MVSWLYNAVYLALVVMASPWILYRIFWQKKNRRGWSARLAGRVPRRCGQRECVWLHAVSVGEIQLLAPLVDQLHRERPDLELVVSTTTESGFDVARSRFSGLPVFFCPLDFSWAVAAAFRRLRPTALVLVELELWPNLLARAEREGVPVMVINGRLSDRSFRRYHLILPIVRSMLRKVRLIAAQSEAYAERFRELGARESQVFVSGNIKFDGAFNPAHAENGKAFFRHFGLQEGEVIWVAGSTQPEEDSLVLDVYDELRGQHPNLRLVLVPRHLVNVASIVAKLESRRIPFLSRSKTLDGQIPSQLRNASPVLVVDVMGELAGWWSLAHLAYVGGSMGKRGGQNMIEPSAHGAAVSFGPRTENFRDVVSMLLDSDAARVIGNRQELFDFVAEALENLPAALEMGERARAIVEGQQGATLRTRLQLEQLLSSSGTVKRSPQRVAA